MPVSSANFVQVQSVFGSAYVPEQHYEPERNYLPPKLEREANLSDLLKVMRRALSLR